MKITDASKTAAPAAARKTGRASAPGRGAAPAPVDKTVLAGIPDNELTPRVRKALMSLLAEVAQLRAELAAAKSRLTEVERLADRDPLLDILNRRAFVRELDRMLAMIDRYGVNASLVFIDLNDLKRINDDKGHLAGDAALAHVVSVISGNIRQTDAAGRLGGDEFGVLLTQAGQQTAEQKAAELADLVRAAPVQWKGGAFTATISAGVVEVTKGVTAGEAMERADTAMYEAKRRK